MPFLPLVRLANVDEERALGGLETRLGLDGRDLVDLLPGLCDQLSVRRHYFGNYSVEGMGSDAWSLTPACGRAAMGLTHGSPQCEGDVAIVAR